MGANKSPEKIPQQFAFSSMSILGLPHPYVFLLQISRSSLKAIFDYTCCTLSIFQKVPKWPKKVSTLLLQVYFIKKGFTNENKYLNIPRTLQTSTHLKWLTKCLFAKYSTVTKYKAFSIWEKSLQRRSQERVFELNKSITE